MAFSALTHGVGGSSRVVIKMRGGNQQQRQRQQFGAFEFSEFFHRLKHIA
jgi:hypothetical protein